MLGLTASDGQAGGVGPTMSDMTALMSLLRLADRIVVPRLGPITGDLGLVPIYSGYAASAVERDRLLDQVTARNRVLETIREMLETLAGPVPVAEALVVALESLRRGLRADEVALLIRPPADDLQWRAFTGPMGHN